MTKEEILKKGRIYASILRLIGMINLFACVLIGLFVLNSYKSESDNLQSIILIKGIGLIVCGIGGLIILLSIAFICESIGESIRD